jgi:prepilin signal peptidase PulO-like enzyme (type II secretory pathway)
MMDLFFYICVFIFGLIVGSFLNCVIYRLQANEKVGGMSRSHCVKCGHVLRWYDLIPVLSFLVLKGKCRYCKKPISIQYPLVEIATGLLFVLIFWHWHFGFDLAFGFWALDLFYLLLIACFLIVIFVYDLKHYLILDKVIYPAIILTILYRFIDSLIVSHWGLGLVIGVFDFLFAAVIAAGFFAIIVFGSRGKYMGAGDIKLGFLMGLVLGYPQILTGLFLSFLFGAIIGTGLIIAKKKTLKSQVPFGPFLVTGTFTAMFCGEQILNWYLGFL